MMKLVVSLLLLALPALAAGEKPLELCRAACAARNLPASCAWLAAKARRSFHQSVRGCVHQVRQGLPVACQLPADLPVCQTNHDCPYGSLCVDAACQVVPCAGPDGAAVCTGLDTCHGDKCVVADCGAASENCPAAFHCQPAEGPLASVSGSCLPDDPGVTYCTVDADCITPATAKFVCRRGRCGPRRRHRHHQMTTTSTSTTTTVTSGTATTTTDTGACNQASDCPGGVSACCGHQCVPDPYAGAGICTTVYTTACTVCEGDIDCDCSFNGTVCDVCQGAASQSGCVDPCNPLG